MIEITSAPLERLSTTTRLICQEATARGWRAWLYYIGSPRVRLERSDGKVLEIVGCAPTTTSYVAASDADDKYLAHLRLQAAGLPVLPTKLLLVDEAEEGALAFLREHKAIVVKPLDAAHGHGVTVNVTQPQVVRVALQSALAFAPKAIIVQKYVAHPVDLRVLCIDGKMIAALQRIPARVKGDGKQTVAALIKQENASGHRGENYRKDINIIPVAIAQEFLGEQWDAVPAAGEWVQVIGTANVGTGGETLDVTEVVPPWLVQSAQTAAKSLDLPVCGVDFLVKDMPTPSSTVAELQPAIIELNKSPSLFIHDRPTYGTPRPAVKAFVDYLATL